MVDAEFEKRRKELKKERTDKLEMLVGGTQGFDRDHASGKTILDDRKFWRSFWTSGLVAWIALVVSITSLIVAICKQP